MVERPGAVVGGLVDLEELITGDFPLVARAFRAVGLGACGLAAEGPAGGEGLVLGASGAGDDTAVTETETLSAVLLAPEDGFRPLGFLAGSSLVLLAAASASFSLWMAGSKQ